MKNSLLVVFLACLFGMISSCNNHSGKIDPYSPDPRPPAEISGMTLVWHDEFNIDGKPDPSNWRYENGFVRNQELQWYQTDNANIVDGRLVIEGRREKMKNPNYDPERSDWRFAREYAEYTASSIQTRGLHEWQFGRFEIRARIDTTMGSWPAIWTLGTSGGWPAGGEIDIMEYYLIDNTPTILANFAWLSDQGRRPKWKDLKKPLSDFTSADPDWVNKYHVWRMDWNEESISLYVDDELLNTVSISETVNPDGFNPFLQPHYVLLNLAIRNYQSTSPPERGFPIPYEVDYVRVYQYNDYLP